MLVVRLRRLAAAPVSLPSIPAMPDLDFECETKALSDWPVVAFDEIDVAVKPLS